MPYLIGTDEAGYGPNLGPLLISATVWEVPDGVGNHDLGERLDGAIVSTPSRVLKSERPCVAMADSKALYKPGGGLQHLERGLLASLAMLGHHPTSWRELWNTLSPDSAEALRSIPWYAGYDCPVPLDTDPDKIPPLSDAITRTSTEAGIRLAGIRSRAVFPDEFNRDVERLGSKGALLSHATLGLVAELIRLVAHRGNISIVCDKHGGRNRYREFLEAHFPDRMIEIHGESRHLSVYRFGLDGRRVEIRFQTKAESCLCVALASMASKYLRELAMRALNHFWSQRIGDLKPTAGYPQDAKRFKAAIDGVRAELGIEDKILWRSR